MFIPGGGGTGSLFSGSGLAQYYVSGTINSYLILMKALSTRDISLGA